MQWLFRSCLFMLSLRIEKKTSLGNQDLVYFFWEKEKFPSNKYKVAVITVSP